MKSDGGAGTHDWLVRAKVLPPRQAIAVADRSALRQRLDRGLANAVTVLEAPAGFGKSTLLGQWCRTLADAGRNVAWLTVGPDDVQDIFVAYLGFALEEAGVMLPGSFWSTAFSHATAHNAVGVSTMLNAIDRHEGPHVLVIDDVETVCDDQTLKLLDQLIRQAPANLHMVLAWRTNPGLPLSDLVLQGCVEVIRVDDMRFTLAEVTSFLADEFGKRDVALLFEKTEGWPVALQIARTMAAGGARPGTILQSLSGTAGIAAQYIQEQVVAGLSPECRAMLTDLSVLEWLHPDAADFVRDEPDSLRLLADLHGIEALVTSVDDADRTYRLHPLLREYLSATLRQADVQRFRALHRRAAQWMWRRGRLVDALGHAQQADDPDLLGELVERAGGILLWLREGMARLRAVGKFLTPELTARFPRLALMRCILLAKQARYREASELLAQVRLATDDFRHDREGGDDQALFFDQYVVEVSLTLYGCLPLTHDLLQKLSAGTTAAADGDPGIQCYQKTLLCVAHSQAALFDDAARYGREGIACCRHPRTDDARIYFEFHLGAIEVARGNPQRAGDYYSKACQASRTNFRSDANLKLIGDVLSAELSLEQNRLGDVKRRLSNVVQRLHRCEAWFDIYAAAYATATEYMVEDDGLDAALTVLDEAQAFITRHQLGKLDSFLIAIRVSLLCWSGDGAAAQHVARDSTLLTLPDADITLGEWTWREAEAYALARMRLFSARGCDDGVAETVAHFSKAFQAKDLLRARLRLSVLAAIHDWRMDRDESATWHLAEALVLAERSGYERAFWLDRADVLPVLDATVARRRRVRREARIAEYGRTLRDRLARPAQAPAAALTFSPRERAVIHELGKGLRDKVIARRLGITENTVRFHLKNIYLKTGTGNRLEAIARIRDLGITS